METEVCILSHGFDLGDIVHTFVAKDCNGFTVFGVTLFEEYLCFDVWPEAWRGIGEICASPMWHFISDYNPDISGAGDDFVYLYGPGVLKAADAHALYLNDYVNRNFLCDMLENAVKQAEQTLEAKKRYKQLTLLNIKE